MKKLFAIPLMGIASTEVESFPSYIARSAFHHKVSVGEVVRLAYSNMPVEYRPENSYFKPEALLQPNKSTIELVYILSQMSFQPLEHSALVWLYKTLGRSSLEIVKGYRWCPECFQEMNKCQTESYIKLKWHLSAITHCPEHNTRLISKCEKCGSDQTTYNRECEFSLCQKCKHDLSTRIVFSNMEHKCRSWEDNGFDVIKLFEDMAKVEFAPLPEDGVIQSLSDVFDNYWGNDEEHKFYQLFGRDEAIAMLHKQLPISLLVARRIAFKLGVSLYTLMSGQALLETQIIDPKLFCAFPDGYAIKRARKNYNHEDKLERILHYLDKHESPSLSQVCKDNDVSTGYLRYRYPALTQKISERHKDFEVRRYLKKVYQAQKMALSYFLDQIYEESPKSKRQAYKEVKRQTGLPKGVIEQAVRRAYNAIY